MRDVPEKPFSTAMICVFAMSRLERQLLSSVLTRLEESEQMRDALAAKIAEESSKVVDHVAGASVEDAIQHGRVPYVPKGESHE